jgi:hypothetical protein
MRVVKPRFVIHDVQDFHEASSHVEWLEIHRSIVRIVSSLGHDLEVIRPGAPPPTASDVIFIGKHTRHTRANAWNIKKGYLPSYVYFDRRGYSGWAEVANRPEMFDQSALISDDDAEAFYNRLVSEVIQANASKIRQSNHEFSPPKRPFVFLPLQLSYDSVVALSRIPFASVYDYAKNWASARGFDLVVKPHPLASNHPFTGKSCHETPKILRHAERCPHVHVSTCSIHRIIPHSLAVLCINSGVGFESLIHLRPVFTAGHSDYHWATHAIRSESDFANIDMHVKPRLGALRTKKFLCYFLNEVLIDVRNEVRIKDKLLSILEEFHSNSRNQTAGAQSDLVTANGKWEG